MNPEKIVKCCDCGCELIRRRLTHNTRCAKCRSAISERQRKERDAKIKKRNICDKCGNIQLKRGACEICEGHTTMHNQCHLCGKWFPRIQRSECFDCLPKFEYNIVDLYPWVKDVPDLAIFKSEDKMITLQHIVEQEAAVYEGFARFVLAHCKTYGEVQAARDIFHSHRGSRSTNNYHQLLEKVGI